MASEAGRLIAAARAAAEAGRLDEAERLCTAVPSGDAAESEALNLRGALAGMRGDLAAAATLFRRVLERQPGNAKAAFNLGECCRRQGDIGGALAGYARAIESDPEMLDAYRHGATAAQAEAARAAAAGEEGIARYARGRAANYLHALALRLEASDPAGAEAAYRAAATLAPEDARVLVNLGGLLLAAERQAEAIAIFRQAVALAPEMVEAQANLGVALGAAGEPTAAIEACRAALALRPGHVTALAALVQHRQRLCDWPGLAEEQAQLLDLVRQGAQTSPTPLLAFCGDPALELHAARLWARRFDVPPERRLPSPSPSAGRLRIGYLSADFRTHVTSLLAVELFERHDRGAFEVTGYAIGTDDDSAMRARLRRGFERFIDLGRMNDAEAAARIHANGVDILVDLGGYADRTRSRILAFRPAPIQVGYLTYPGSMGAAFIDYILADAFVAPPANEEFFSEKLALLPHCYQVNSARPVGATPPRSSCGLPEQGFVFCCFNLAYKITPAVFDVWMRLLHAVPGSVLWLLAEGAGADNLRREAAARGVAPERLVFAPWVPLPEHLGRLANADLFLDTVPCGAHTTASDALWVGLPVLTCAERSFVSRVAGSLLHALGLPELVTTSRDAYEAQALRLARQPDLLAALRRRLSADRATAAPFDTRRQARYIERAFAEMWRIHGAGESPRRFAVAAD